MTTPVVANDPDGKTKTISTEAGLRRLGRQLQRTEQELWSDLALRALGVGKVDKALKILRFACADAVPWAWMQGWETDRACCCKLPTHVFLLKCLIYSLNI